MDNYQTVQYDALQKAKEALGRTPPSHYYGVALAVTALCVSGVVFLNTATRLLLKIEAKLEAEEIEA
jgi:hypothetical protein